MGVAMDGFAGRIAWRPSRWLPAALCLLAIAAVASAWLSALPQAICVAVSVLVPAYVGWLLHREWKRPACLLIRSADDAGWRIECQGSVEILRHAATSFRGGLVVLTLVDEDGRRRRYAWWPDTLDATGRRALRLAARAGHGDTPVGAQA